MAKSVVLMRHTDADGDVLTEDGVRAAVEVGDRLGSGYEVLVSSGAQRATQTAACVLAGSTATAPRGVVVEPRFRSVVEDRWRAAYESAGAGDIESFRKADPDLVDKEARLLAETLEDVFDRLPEGGRALVVGHSPMQEAAVYGLTGVIVEPLSKGAAVRVVADAGKYSVEPVG